MTIDAKIRERIAKMAGMLGSDSENEALVALRMIKRTMAVNNASFGELSNLIAGGGGGSERIVYRDRPVYRERERDEAPWVSKIVEMADSILNTRLSLGRAERTFVGEMRAAASLSREFRMTPRQARWFQSIYGRFGNREKAAPGTGTGKAGTHDFD